MAVPRLSERTSPPTRDPLRFLVCFLVHRLSVGGLPSGKWCMQEGKEDGTDPSWLGFGVAL